MVKDLISRFSWPVLLIICISISAVGQVYGHPVIAFNIAYLFLAVTLFFLERRIPFENKWLENDGQTFANIAHTLTSKGVVQGLVIFGGVIGITSYVTPMAGEAYGIWPRHWPMPVQIIMGLAAAEFGLYWAHRLGHEVGIFWRFHAVHHSVNRLWIINTGRFHFIDSVISIVLGAGILIALGAPLEIITWLSAITAYIGMLTHCNVDMKFKWLSYIFNTPELHRWHHSRKLVEGNRNYGENLMLWDHIFRTWIRPDRRPSANIGITDDMPTTFLKQLIWPFQKPKKKFYTERHLRKAKKI
ncbi:MAG TPA: sterol desaturase family protein [Alphaproteobacteria bacterium]|nr:sterol desaturase family protein [Alphaproteobacteria bacterium]